MLADLSFYYLLLIGFAAGLTDAAAGGEGLLQIPGLFNLLPNITPVASVMGIDKFVSCRGALAVTGQHLRRIFVPWKILLPAAALAFAASYLGANAVAYFPVQYMKSAMLVIMIAMCSYTPLKEDLGQTAHTEELTRRRTWWGLFFDALIGFYGGILEPGTGSLLAFVFVRFYGYDLLTADVVGKVISSTTNLAALIFFIPQEYVVWAWAVLLVLANLCGDVVGARLAIRGGTRLLRYESMLLLCLMIGKFVWDLLSWC